ncbi:Ribosomal RNA large subunit methyltransferase L [Porphyromonas crevioricanis]|uniref:Ribosomal RNA large subunit methyltransferase L n=1 Tax=Porphyromonas crevioricanis TaxID=393921 RepID=A0A2X4PZU2_9PORP|nr:THUMP domain-containing protein [Porphyromonas crevioricanis]GAD06680.1 hypothetical protein PORCAN_278 [Porphyromonas crevioricanis JCM 13913]SQH73347.1 Ribosomal RNA large subunit methyltransferase L [Porphyromonas crevioricanis]
MTETFEIVAKTLHGLEDVLAEELRQLGAQNIRPGKRMVAFEGDKRLLYAANLKLRTALRILKPVLKFQAQDADEVYAHMQQFDWSAILSPTNTFAIDPVVYSETFRHSRYVSYRAKDAIADFFVEKYGKRPSVRLHNPDILINIHISHQDVTVSLDSSGESLHKRGYRVAQTEAPLNEVLAAGIILKTGWQDDCDLIDPMCGSGTLVIEAALIAANIAPGIYRDRFAFQSWSDYDTELFDELYQDSSEEREPEHKIYGSDILPEAIRIAQKNVDRSGLGKYIKLQVLPMQQHPKPEAPFVLITNPPYGERLGLRSGEDLYAMIGERLKHNFGSGKAWILAHKTEHFNSIGLKPMYKEELMNGALHCELRGYELFEGTFSEHRAEQRQKGQTATIHREKKERSERPRPANYTRPPQRENKRFEDKKNRTSYTSKERGRYHEDEGKFATSSPAMKRSENGDREKSFRGERKPTLQKTRAGGTLDKRAYEPGFYRRGKTEEKPVISRTRKRIGDYLSGKVSQTTEMARLQRIRKARKQETDWPEDRKKAIYDGEDTDLDQKRRSPKKTHREIQIIRNEDTNQ